MSMPNQSVNATSSLTKISDKTADNNKNKEMENMKVKTIYCCN